MKKSLSILLFILLTISLFSKAASRQGNFYLTAGPSLQINTLGFETAPSPISFTLGLGYKFSLGSLFSIVPELSEWQGYYLVIDEKIAPAAVEKRDALVIHALLDLPLLINISTKNSIYSFGLGVSLLNRFALPVSVLPENEKDRVKAINDYFWSDLRYFYPSASFFWDWVLENGSSFGFSIKAFYPIANHQTGENILQNAVISLKVRAFFPNKKRKQAETNEQ